MILVTTITVQSLTSKSIDIERHQSAMAILYTNTSIYESKLDRLAVDLTVNIDE